MNFSNNKYFEKAMEVKFEEQAVHSPEDAFLLLIRGLDYESLDHLSTLIGKTYLSSKGIDLDDENNEELANKTSYNLTQSLDLSIQEKRMIFEFAKNCIEQKDSLGNKMTLGSKRTEDGKFNATSWISHCIYSGETCARLADMIGLNPQVAQTLGLLHDFGRRGNFRFIHTIIGFENLIDLGWDSEAISCLTHSFINGGRCSNNEEAVEGFYVDENGEQKWKVGTTKDELTQFLEKYNYTKYDLILNISDLMATDKGIVSPMVRLEDIKGRRNIDPTNRGFFLSEFNNLLIDFLNETNYSNGELKYTKATKDMSIKQIENNLSLVSQKFFDAFSSYDYDPKNNSHSNRTIK